jgi:outer membrane immunogenic protein
MKKSLIAAAALAASFTLIATTARADGADGGWHGFYVGLHGSYLESDTTYATPATPQQSLDGALLGFQAGVNFHLSPNWVFGIEGDLSFGEINDFIRDGNFLTEDGSIDMAGTLRARLGYAVSPGALIYATGGLAWDSLEQGSTCPAAAPFGVCALTGAFDARSTETYMGWVAGGGIEYKIAPKWSLKTEVMAGDFGSQDYTATIPVFGTVTAPVEHDLNLLVQFGVNFHLN